jgi:chaperone modulatory protein CbpM
MPTDADDMLWLHAQTRISIVELAQSAGLAETVLRELVEYGALSPAEAGSNPWIFTGDCVVRVRRAARLCSDLELETPALALVLSFLERIERLESEVRRLSVQVVEPRG